MAIFLSPKQEQKELAPIHQELINSGRIIRVYLDEIVTNASISRSPELGMIKLITCPESEAVEVVKEIRSGLIEESIIKFVGDILVYKFPKLSRKEIEIMFALEDLRQTKVFQEAKDEGIQLGKQEGIKIGKREGEVALLLRLLKRKFASIDRELINRIETLSLEQLENLGEALLDFNSMDDLSDWLNRNKN